MTNPRQLVHATFGGGVDERTRPELVDPMGAFVAIENVRVPQMGGFGKRYGFAARSLVRTDGSSRSGGYKVFADDDATCVVDGTNIDVYSATLGKSHTAGRVCEVSHRLIPAPGVSSTSFLGDIESVNGYLAVVAQAETSIGYGVVMDLATLAVVDGPTTLFQADNPPLVGSFSSRYFAALVPLVASTALSLMLFDTQAPGSGWNNIATVTTVWNCTGGGTGKYAIHSLSDRVAVAYRTTGGTDRVTIKTYNQTGLLETTTVNTSSTDPSSISLGGSTADTLWVAWNEGTAVKVKGLAASVLATVKATTATVITATVSVGRVKCVHDANTTGAGRLVVTDGTTPGSMCLRTWTTSAGAVTPGPAQKNVPHCTPVGRPFQYGTRFYQTVWPDTDRAPYTPVVTDITDDLTYVRPIASPSPDLMSIGGFEAKFVQGATSTKRIWGYSVLRSSVALVPQLLELDFAGTGRWQAVKHGRSTFLTGALATYFDGVRCQEVGFCQPPSTPTTSTSGTGVTLANGRRYVAVYEDVDADGNWIVSSISNPSTSTGAVANKTITVSTGPLSVSWRAAGPSARVAFYATLDSNNNQPPYYRLGTTPNSTSAVTVTYSDVTTDATLATAAELYSPNLPGTAGAPFDRRAPPGLSCLVSYNEMLVGTDGQNVYWSGQPVDGEATWFNPDFQLPLPGVTALATQDGTLFAFTQRAIYAVAGDAPADNGSSGGLGTPRRLAVDVGCIEPRSVAVTAKGIFFQSSRGIELLDRGGSVTWIGESVLQTLDAFPVCTAATVDQAEALVYFELAAAETANRVSGSGRALVYDLSRDKWGVDRRKNQAGTADSPAQSAAVLYTGSAYRYAWLGTDGRVYVEDQTTHLDPGSAWVTKRAITGAYKLAGVQGYQMLERVRLLLKYATDHDLALYWASDYSGSYATPRTWTRAQIATITASLPNEQVEHPLDDNVAGQAITFKLEDATPTGGSVGTGEGATWLAVSVMGTTRDGFYPLPDACR